MKELLSGNEAVARGAYEAGVKFAAAYPGTPSTEILENIGKRYPEIFSEWATNEKVALEVAFGAAMGGQRSLCAMKHVGVNVAADPLMTASYIGVNGGLVLVSADDPGMHSSQNEQDNRHFAKFAKIPMFEPGDSQEAKDFLQEAYRVSERFDTPVLFRMTTRTCHAKSVVELGEKETVADKPYAREMSKYVMLPSSARKRRVVVEERLRKLADYAETTPLNRVEMRDKKLGIIISGVCYQYAREVYPEASILKLGFTYPLPLKKIADFVRQVQKALVIEELDPFLEEQIKAAGISVQGREGIPGIGELTVDVIRQAAGLAEPQPSLVPPLPARPPVLCPGCPHRGAFHTLRQMKLTISGDIGCYTLGALPPLNSMDLCLCMGASVSGALGLGQALPPEQSKKVVGVIGDSTFLHSGITGLVDAVYNHRRGLIIILDNRITAMTGQQDHAASGKTLMGQEAPRVNLEKLCLALGVPHVRRVGAFDLALLKKTLQEELAFEGLSVVIVEGDCLVHRRDKIRTALAVDASKCKECKLCHGAGCPAICQDADGKTYIDAALCAGCGVCEQICKFKAIGKVAQEVRA